MMQMEPVFGVSAEVSYLVTTVFLLGYTFGVRHTFVFISNLLQFTYLLSSLQPIVWGPGSEVVGRRPVFVVALTLYTLFILGQPLAKNIETLLITRFLSAFFASAPLTNCGGMIADIWDPIGRGPATGLFTACVFLGPVCGPIVSAAYVCFCLLCRRVLMGSVQDYAEWGQLALGVLGYDDVRGRGDGYDDCVFRRDVRACYSC